MKTSTLLLLGGAGLGALLMMKPKPSAATADASLISPGMYIVQDIHGNVVGKYSTLAQAEGVAGTWGQSSGNTVWYNGAQIGGASVYGGGGSSSSGGGTDWNPMDSPNFNTVASGVASFFGF